MYIRTQRALAVGVSVTHRMMLIYKVAVGLVKKDRFKKALGEVKENGFGDGYDIVGYGEEFLRVCKEPNIFIWCNKKQIPKYFNYYLGRKNLNFEILTWHKTNAMPAYSKKYLTDTEFILYFKGRGVCNPNCYEDAKTYYVSPANKKEKKSLSSPYYQTC